jgi:ribosomal protein S18 acetylase RimI-like enzyme
MCNKIDVVAQLTIPLDIEYKIRNICIDDIETIKIINCNEDTISKELIDSYPYQFILEINSNIIGYILSIPQLSTLTILNIYVTDEYKRLGCATKLLNYLIHSYTKIIYQNMKIKVLTCKISENNIISFLFFIKNNFKWLRTNNGFKILIKNI